MEDLVEGYDAASEGEEGEEFGKEVDKLMAMANHVYRLGRIMPRIK